ncbi:hypothetical protein RRG08_001383 [Elysia crispata]|uniref:SCP domain-containing protein n=1 Tax=Elysia crispata TaxID=231223 RepID=A0AAE1DLC5_9GAST|nr:hypothetical protein RRG08_001383 [Elysia crispata]
MLKSIVFFNEIPRAMDFHYDGRPVAIILLIAATLTLKAPVAGGANSVLTCRPEFANLTPKHTMCLEDSDKVMQSGVSRTDKKLILDFHNKVRREAMPKATDLAALIWDDRLAEVAQKLTRQCRMYHDANRGIPYYDLSIGQNIAGGSLNWKRAMETWYKEKNLFKYGQDPKEYLGQGGWKKIGHYTQMVSHRAHRVGCGFARCQNGRFYACNYAQGQISFRFPYTNGTERCSACSSSCKNGLCDCKGKLCFNKGKLDINTCTCKCQKIYKGAECRTLECPQQDGRSCGGKWPESFCKKFSNVPFDCPYMCGKCPA